MRKYQDEMNNDGGKLKKNLSFSETRESSLKDKSVEREAASDFLQKRSHRDPLKGK